MKKLYAAQYLAESGCGIHDDIWADSELDVRKQLINAKTIFSIEEKSVLDKFSTRISGIQTQLRILQHDLDIFFGRA